MLLFTASDESVQASFSLLFGSTEFMSNTEIEPTTVFDQTRDSPWLQAFLIAFVSVSISLTLSVSVSVCVCVNGWGAVSISLRFTD